MKLDPTSFLVTSPATVSLKRLEKELAQRGYTLGYLPAKGGGPLTLKEILERRIPNLYALRYGEIDDLCVSLTVQRGGETIVTRNVPRSATGPDFKKIFIGSRGRYGRVLEATFKISPRPVQEERHRILWKDPAGKRRFLKLFWSSGIRPLTLRVTLRDGGVRSVTLELAGKREIVQAERECLKRYLRETEGKIK